MDPYSAWLSGGRQATDYSVAIDAWISILDNPTTIELFRGPSVIVRLAFDDGNQTVINGPQAVQIPRMLTILGVYNHPSPQVEDTDLIPGDRFVIGADEYEVLDVMKDLGTVQAHARRTT